jgi:hypothetical protein
MRFDGTGRGNATGAPLEAVIQDLCDTRVDLKRTTSAVEKMRESSDQNTTILQGMAVTLVEIRDLLADLKLETQTGIEEAKQFRTKMDSMEVRLNESRAALEANTRARGPA